MRWAVHVARIWEKRGLYGILVGKPERKRPLVRRTRRWEDNIKIFRKKDVVVWNGSSWLRIGTSGRHL
jgi:hypothetical protein